MDPLQETLTHLPHTPGVYLYRDAEGTVVYVGKAKDLFNRVHQYFTDPRLLPEKTRQLRKVINSIETVQVASEFDALLLEAKLIRHYTPKYNSIAKDDKSPIYIVIKPTAFLPVVVLDRKSKLKDAPEGEYFGPFPSRRIAQRLLRTLRRSIPFCQEVRQTGSACFYRHLGLCNPCPGQIAGITDTQEKQHMRRRYLMSIQRLKWVLSGRSKETIQSMEREMREASDAQRFEDAGRLRDQIQSLLVSIHTRYDPFAFEATDQLERSPNDQTENLQAVLKRYYPQLGNLARIECYDMSTFQGSASVGSMVVFIEGIPHTDLYRRFRIRTTANRSDVDMMQEVIIRRLKHTEWEYPDLLVVDGGKPQVAAIRRILTEHSLPIPLIGLAKRFERIVVPSGSEFAVISVPLSNPSIQILQRIRDEAHRFANAYHKTLRSAAFVGRKSRQTTSPPKPAKETQA